MNAILLGGACLGALATILAADPAKVPSVQDRAQQDRGSMTSTIEVDTATGEITETNVIAFLD